MTDTRGSLGEYGEQVAERHLVGAGLRILDRNWRCALGEVDRVAMDGDTLVICEVKTRRGLDYGSPLEAVTWRKLARLRRLAAQWIRDHDAHPAAVRIDVVGVLARPGAGAVVEHLRGVA